MKSTTNPKLPDFCYYFLPENGPGNYIVGIRNGESGCYHTDYDIIDPAAAKKLVDDSNAKINVSELQALCMFHGSLFGWDTPGADPDKMALAGALLGADALQPA